jgi:hypothetical protein
VDHARSRAITRFFQHPHLPPVSRARHYCNVMNLRRIRVQHRASIQYLGFDVGGIAQLDGRAVATLPVLVNRKSKNNQKMILTIPLPKTILSP